MYSSSNKTKLSLYVKKYIREREREKLSFSLLKQPTGPNEYIIFG